MKRIRRSIICIISVVSCICLMACGNSVSAQVEEMKSTAYETQEVEPEIEENSSEEMTETESVEESTEEITSEMETTEEETTTEEEVVETPKFIITEEEFAARVMFRPHMELMPITDEYSTALVAAIEAQLASYGREIQFKDGMMGRSYPIRFGEDINTVADDIVMDIESFFFDGGNCYEIHHVKKADNGYIVSYSVE